MITKLISVDPGDRHVGVAFFETEEVDPWAPPGQDHDRGWECVDAQEWTPEEFTDALAESLLSNDIECVVFERFRLYADKAAEQTGSEFGTSQLIGVIKYLVGLNNRHAAEHARVDQPGSADMLACEQVGGWHADPANRPHQVRLIGQQADIKKPTTGILRSRGVKSTAKRLKAGGHAFDAELHGWYYLLHGLGLGRPS